MAQLNSLIVTGDSRFLNTINGNITSANGIHRATMATSSTATAFVLTADDIDSLYDGLIIYCKNTVVNSAANCTINLNGLGAKRIWVSQDNGYCTTHWSKNQAYLFVYNNTDSVWELQQGRNTNSDTYDRNRYNCNIKAGTTAIVAGNIIVADSNGLYHHLKDGAAFDIRYPILYANGAIAANSTGTNNYDILHITITTTQSISMTAYLPVYIKGTLAGTIFTPISTAPLTQTLATSTDGYYYMKLGVATAATTLYLQEVHPIYAYKSDKIVEVNNDSDVSIPFIVGTGSTAGTWLGELPGLNTYYDGLLILYKPSIAGAGTTTLNINSLGAKTCYLNNGTKLTTHFPVNQPILLAYSASQNSGCWMCMDNYCDGNDTSTVHSYYSRGTAGSNGIKQYSLFARMDDGTYSSFTTSSGTGTKTMDTTHAFDIRKIYYANRSSDLASGSTLGDNQMSQQENTVDGRYTFNGITTSSGFTANQPIYLVFEKQTSNNYHKLKNPYWTHTPNDTEALYVLIGFTRSVYQFSLMMDNAVYECIGEEGHYKIIPYSASGSGGGGSEGIWTASVTALAGDATITITNSNILATSMIDIYTQSASGYQVNIKTAVVDAVNHTLTITFVAVAESTDFKLHIYNN